MARIYFIFSKDPLAKIKLFLRERHASEKIEEYVNIAKKYFPKSYGEDDGLTKKSKTIIP